MYYSTMDFATEEVVDAVMVLMDGYFKNRYTTIGRLKESSENIAAALDGKPVRVGILITLYDADGHATASLTGSREIPFKSMTVYPDDFDPDEIPF